MTWFLIFVNATILYFMYEAPAFMTYLMYSGIFWAIWIPLLMMVRAHQAKVEAERNVELEKNLELLEQRHEEIEKGGSPEFDNYDNIKNVGKVLWQESGVRVGTFKSSTIYTSKRIGYAQRGSRTRQKNTIGGFGTVSAGGTRGKRETIVEDVDMGHYNVYFTTTGIKLSGHNFINLTQNSVESFRRENGTDLRFNMTKGFPYIMKCGTHQRAQLMMAAAQAII